VSDDHLAGVFVRFDCDEDRGDTLIEAAEYGWWYSTSVPGGTVIAGFMTDTDLIRELHLNRRECWNELLAGAPLTSERLSDGKAKGDPEVFTANSQRLSEMGGAGWVAAGDAAMTFDPLSSQGIVKALRSGKLASFVAADFLLRGVDSYEKYRRSAEAEYSAYRSAKRDYYAMEQRWPEATFWKRRF
jgi:flavin-dependent dehydrogenase